MNPVSVTFDHDVALVQIDNPPVNAVSHAVRAGLVVALEQIETRDDIKIAILYCAGSTFIAGADIKEFGTTPQPPLLGDVVRKIEACPIPIVAALHGSVLGGGLEIALGCSYRIAVRMAKLGFPEVNIGLIPGAGGTVRLPRLLPATQALKFIVEGKPVAADTAKSMGLVDAIVGEDLVAEARHFAESVKNKEKPVPLSQRQTVSNNSDPDFIAAAKKALSRAGRIEARGEAVEALQRSLTLSADEALAAEREAFARLRQGHQSHAMRYAFFAERSAQKLKDIKGISPRSVETVGVVGGGTMGAGIATSFLMNGFQVHMVERDEDALGRGLASVHSHLDSAKSRGLIDQNRRVQLSEKLSGSTMLADMGTRDLIIEAVFEDMAIKKQLFADLDAVARPNAILATNTSYLDVNQIAEAVKNPSRVLGLHFFSPAHIMKLLEIVRTDAIAPDVLATGMNLAKRLGKIGVPARVCDGFIGNRIMNAYRSALEELLLEGALPHDIDTAMTDFGFAMGLFAVQDMAGLDISWARRKAKYADGLTADKAATIPDLLCSMGRFGRKSGAGYYRYDGADNKLARDPEIEELIVAQSARMGMERRSIDAETIIKTALDAMQKEGHAVLTEGIAASPEAIDTVMINGYGFPRWRGGPMFMADHAG